MYITVCLSGPAVQPAAVGDKRVGESRVGRLRGEVRGGRGERAGAGGEGWGTRWCRGEGVQEGGACRCRRGSRASSPARTRGRAGRWSRCAAALGGTLPCHIMMWIGCCDLYNIQCHVRITRESTVICNITGPRGVGCDDSVLYSVSVLITRDSAVIVCKRVESRGA